MNNYANVGDEEGRSSNTTIELESLVSPLRRKSEGPIDKFMERIDEQVNIRKLMKVWGPRIEFFVRLMLVMTFLNDSYGMATQFAEQIDTVANNGYPFRWLVASTPNFVTLMSTIVLGLGLCIQLFGSCYVLVSHDIHIATKALICWVIMQPFLYAQLSNMELVSESISLIGGLLMLYVHAQSKQKRSGSDANNELTSLIGRLLLPAAYIYQAMQFFFSAKTLDETNGFFTYISSLSMFVVNMAVLVVLMIGSSLVAIGLKSRFIALVFAFINLGLVCHQHPLWRFLSLSDGHWKVNEVYMWLPNVSMEGQNEAGTTDSEDPWEIYNLHQYYFFLGLSTSGALLLLAQLGPGEIAVQKNEFILPVVARGMD